MGIEHSYPFVCINLIVAMGLLSGSGLTVLILYTYLTPIVNIYF